MVKLALFFIPHLGNVTNPAIEKKAMRARSRPKRLDDGTTSHEQDDEPIFNDANDPDWNSDDDVSDLDEEEEKERKSSTRCTLESTALAVSIISGHRCPVCKACMRTNELLEEHFNDEHGSDGEISCNVPDCDAMLCLSSSSLNHALTSHADKCQFDCLFCQEKTLGFEAAKIHMGTQHIFGCYLCFEGFDTDIELHDHVTDHHVEDGKLTCNICMFTCKANSETRFFSHMKLHLGMTEHLCRYCVPKQFYSSRLSLQEHLCDSHNPGLPDTPFVCPTKRCDFRTSSANQLQRHWRVGCIKLACRTCGKKFQHPHSRTNHEFHCGRPERLLSCDQCSYRTHTNHLLKRHVHLIHEKKAFSKCKVEECQYCSRKPTTRKPRVNGSSISSSRAKIVITRRVNQTSQPNRPNRRFKHGMLNCHFPQCGFYGETPAMLEKHVKCEHKIQDTGELTGRKSSVICTLCGKLARDSHQLASHEFSVHGLPSQHQCEICSKSFSRSYYLNNHRREQHGLKLGVPAVKERDKHGSSNRKGHSKPSGKLYKCELCNFQTIYVGNLSRHNKTPDHLEAVKNQNQDCCMETAASECVLSDEDGIHKCDRCDFQTKYARNLTYHKISACQAPGQDRSGTEKKKKKTSSGSVHSCPLCDYKTPPGMWFRHLRRHLYSKHVRKGEKIPEGYDMNLAKCRLCDYTALDESRITRHMKRHVRQGEIIPDEYVALEIEDNT